MIGLGLSIFQAAVRRLIKPALTALGPLSLSGPLTNGTASSGTIAGAASGSTITGALTGLSINSSARTYSFDGTAAVGTVGTLTETLAGATNSPHTTALPAVTSASSAWTPAQLGSALAAQWNLYDASTVVLNGSNFASAANQAAGGTATLSQATAASQPPYTSGTGLVIPSTSLGVAAFGNMPTGEVTMFVIGSALPPDSGNYRNLLLTGYHENPVMLYKGSSTSLGEYESGSFYQFGSLTWSGPGFVLAHILTGTPNSAALNGSAWSAATANFSAGPPTYLGNSDAGGQGFGTIYLVLVITGALSTSDKQKLEGWAARVPALQSQGITTALLPAGHPYKSVAP